jgi:hypothetical protein
MDRTPLAGKDPALGELVDRLAADLGPDSFVLMDHWEDLMAIGLAQPSHHDVLIYVAVKVDDEGEVLTSENRYFYECETPEESDDHGYAVSGRGDHVAYEGVRKAVAQRLQLG